MGLNKPTSSSNTTYLQIIGGQLRQRIKEKTQSDDIERVTKEGKVVYERPYGSITAIIQDVSVRFNDVIRDDELTIRMSDAGENYNISLSMKSDFAKNFIEKLPNIPTGYIFLKPYCFDDKEKKDANGNPKQVKGFTIKKDNDDGETIARYYTRETPHDMPTIPAGTAFSDPKNKKIVANWKIDIEEFRKTVVDNQRGKFTNATFDNAPSVTPHIDESDDDLPF